MRPRPTTLFNVMKGILDWNKKPSTLSYVPEDDLALVFSDCVLRQNYQNTQWHRTLGYDAVFWWDQGQYMSRSIRLPWILASLIFSCYRKWHQTDEFWFALFKLWIGQGTDMASVFLQSLTNVVKLSLQNASIPSFHHFPSVPLSNPC